MGSSRIINWTITRSGAGMTIVGTNADTGAPVKVVKVKQIDGGRDGEPAIATDDVGDRHELA